MEPNNLILSYLTRSVVSSVITTLLPTEPTHTLTLYCNLLLSFFERGEISTSFCLLAGIALNGMIFRLLPFPSLSPIFLVAGW